MPLLRNLKNAIIRILFPPLCLSCKHYLDNQEELSAICRKCISKITVHTTLFCPICRARLPDNKKICHKNSHYLLGAATNYTGPVVELIHHYKYESWTRLLGPLNQILISYLHNLPTEELNLKNYVVIPIPLHKNREHARGFNQAKDLAQVIAAHYQIPLINSLTRCRETQPQVKLKDWEKRRSNIKRIFQIINPDKIRGKNVILVDDVYTSGATINEAANGLRSAGTRKIVALVIAKSN